MERPKHIPHRLIGAVLFGLVAIFLIVYVRSLDWQTLRELRLDWLRFGLAVAFGLAFLYSGAYIWRVILRALGANSLPSYPTTTAVYAKAWMGRYIPGTVTWIAGKVYMARNWGISKSRLSVTSLLEAGAQVGAFTFIGFVFLGADQRLNLIPAAGQVALIALGLLVLVCLLPPVFNRIIALILRFKSKQPASTELQINNAAVGRSFGLYVIAGLLYGIGHYCVIWALVPDFALHHLTYVIGASCLATVAGMAAPFAPSGIGIKDGLLLLLLAAILPNETALAATILIRLWSVLTDIIFLGLSHFSADRKGVTTNA